MIASAPWAVGAEWLLFLGVVLYTVWERLPDVCNVCPPIPPPPLAPLPFPRHCLSFFVFLGGGGCGGGGGGRKQDQTHIFSTCVGLEVLYPS